MTTTAKEVLRQNLYYFIILVLSIGVLVVFPFLKSSADVGWGFTSTKAGWVIWWFEKGSIAGINMCLFTAFKKQAILNIKEDPTYKKAKEILNKVKEKKSEPKSPVKYQAQSYLKKGTTMTVTTFCSLIAIGNMILRFSYITLISYACTLLMGLVFGIFAMKADELYWTNDYYYYALQEERKQNDP